MIQVLNIRVLRANKIKKDTNKPSSVFLQKYGHFILSLTLFDTEFVLRDRMEIPQVLSVFPSEKHLQTLSLPPFVFLK